MTPIAWFAVALLTGDGDPIEGQVVVDGQPCEAARCLLEPGRHVLELADRPATAFFLPEGAESVRATPAVDAARYGVAMRRDGEPAPMPELPTPGPGAIVPYGYTVPAELPSAIRVARHADNNCNNPIQRIDEVPLASYVAGVVHGEIGVFRAAGTGNGVQIDRADRDRRVKASFETFAVAARSYAVWWVLRRGLEADYHIHDGPCNQVYQDARDPLSEAAAQSTAGQILVSADDHSDLGKHEYASACARHGTLPSGRNANTVRQQDIIPDDGLQRVCVGSWCGHDSYNMAHQDNPYVDRANNRCLVRGICQWGSLERAVRGDSYTEIIAHYQPFLVIRDGDAPAGLGGLQGSVRDGNGDPIAGAQDAGVADAGLAQVDAGSGSRSGSGGTPAEPPGACACGAGTPFDALLWLAPLLTLRRKKEL